VPATVNNLASTDDYFVLGEHQRPLLTNSMGSPIEIFDTSGPAGSGPVPHCHPWDEIYLMLDGELDVWIDGEVQRLGAGSVVHIPSPTVHHYRNVGDDTHFLTIVTRGNAAEMFEELSSTVEMSPPDMQAVKKVATTHGLEFFD
jgi:quercetin dioxygenase-like cupin family protein